MDQRNKLRSSMLRAASIGQAQFFLCSPVLHHAIKGHQFENSLNASAVVELPPCFLVSPTIIFSLVQPSPSPHSSWVVACRGRAPRGPFSSCLAPWSPEWGITSSIDINYLTRCSISITDKEKSSCRKISLFNTRQIRAEAKIVAEGNYKYPILPETA